MGRRNLEVGVEPYQHRERGAATLLSLDLDNFSALVIYVPAGAAADPGLWPKYVEQRARQAALSREDSMPGSLAACAAVARGAGPEVRELMERLVEAPVYRWSRSPALQVGRRIRQTRTDAVGKELRRPAVKSLNAAAVFATPAATQAVDPRGLQTGCRNKAWENSGGSPRPERGQRPSLVGAWNEALLARFAPAQRERPRLVAARQRIEILGRAWSCRAAGAICKSTWNGGAHLALRLPPGYQHSYRPGWPWPASGGGRHEIGSGCGGAGRWRAGHRRRVEGGGRTGRSGLFDRHGAAGRLAGAGAPCFWPWRSCPAIAAINSIPDPRAVACELLADCLQAAAWRGLYETAVRRKESGWPACTWPWRIRDGSGHRGRRGR